MINDIPSFLSQIREIIFNKSRQFQKKYINVFEDVMNDCLNDYLATINSFGISEESKEYKKALTVKAQLIRIIEVSFEGKRSQAYSMLKDLMNDLLEDGMVCEHDFDSYLYRMRVCDMRRDIQRKELFHIPFEQKRIIKTQRYSTPGYPCLYLARSIYSCWEEMHRPPINSTLVSLFKAREEYANDNNLQFNLVDLRIPSEDLFEKNEKFYVSFLPVIIACTIPVDNQSDIFKPEYILPQFILEWVIEDGKKDNKVGENLIGVTYTSAFYNEEFFKLDFEWDNIALPVQTSNKSGHCSILSNLLELTKPTCYEYEVMQGNMHNTGVWDNGPKRGRGYNDPKTDYYSSTFSRLEEELESRERELI